MRFAYLFVILFVLVNLKARSQDEDWKNKYLLVIKDMQEVSKIKKKDIFLNLRLIQLHSEKLNLLLDAESALLLRGLDGAGLKEDNLLRIRELITKDQKDIESISKVLEKSTKDPDILMQIYYLKGLNYYSLKKYSEFHINFKTAESYCKDKELCFKIKNKLADYHFNNGKFNEAIHYYLQVIKKDSPWLSKSFFNLAWCYFKLEKSDNAVINLKIAKKLSGDPKYYALGKQLDKAIFLIFAQSGKTKQSLEYLNKNMMYSYDHLYQFIQDTFEYGIKEDLPFLFSEIDKIKKNHDQEVKLLTRKIIYLRNIKRYDLIHINITKYLSSFTATNPVSQDLKRELIQALLDYNGLLHEFLLARNMSSTHIAEKYLYIIKDNLALLRNIDPENTLKYYFFEGESLFSIKNYTLANQSYLKGIKELSKGKQKGTVNSSLEQIYLPKIFDSLFKSLEIQKDDTATALVFKYYLYFYPNHPTSRDIYRRLLSIEQNSLKPLNAVPLLQRYVKFFPQDKLLQQNQLKGMIVIFINEQDLKSLGIIKPLIENDFISLKSDLLESIHEAMSSIELSLVMKNSEGKSIDELFADLDEFRNKNKGVYQLEYRIFLKKLELAQAKNLYAMIGSLLEEALQMMLPLEKQKFNINLNFYLNKACLNSPMKECHRLISLFRKYQITLNEENKTIYFRTAIALKKYQMASSLADTPAKQDYLLKSLMLTYPSAESDFFTFLPVKSRDILFFLLEQKFWRKYFANQDVKKLALYINKIKDPDHRIKLQKLVEDFENAVKKSSIDLPGPPLPLAENEITFEVFSIFLQGFVKDFQIKFSIVDHEIQNIHPNLIPEFVNNLNKSISNTSLLFKSYNQNTTNGELKKAIENEMTKICNLLDKKIELYNELAFNAWKQPFINVGKEFQNSNFSTSSDFTEGIMWENL
jgi:hypothetical protein